MLPMLPIGFVLAIAALLGSLTMDGGSITSLINPSAMLLVLVGTVAATAAGSTMSDLKKAPKLLMGIMKPSKSNLNAVVEEICALADVARREGRLKLEARLDQGKIDPFLARGVSLVVNGSDEERIRQILEEDLAVYEEERSTGAGIFETAGGFAPTLGILGTVMGLISVLSNLSNIAKLAPSIATAFTATLWGVASANLFWLPIANNLKSQTKQLVRQRLAIVEGCVAMSRGQNPRVIRELLAVYIDEAEGKAKGKGKVGTRPKVEAVKTEGTPSQGESADNRRAVS